MAVPPFGEGELALLRATTDELKAVRLELAELLVAERQGRIEAYHDSDEKSSTARDRYADYVVLDLSNEITKLRAQVNALCDERDLLIAWLNAGG